MEETISTSRARLSEQCRTPECPTPGLEGSSHTATRAGSSQHGAALAGTASVRGVDVSVPAVGSSKRRMGKRARSHWCSARPHQLPSDADRGTAVALPGSPFHLDFKKPLN